MSEQLFTDAAADTSSPRAKDGYVVVARRYRPQTFDELIGQEHVSRALAGAIQSNRVGHAYLFTGARGVGKTSAARILAKALNCERGTSPVPCNACETCRSIAAGSDVDVLEIDGASNRGIDEIRELRQTVSVRPSRSRFKVYIIDEVHMLTREAFNALLKTLEEPPEHVKFIFCTTEAEKLPVTILSRCQRFDFAGIRSEAIAARLEQIVEAEGVAYDREALELLARRAGGSMRDSQSLLEQLLAFSQQRLGVAEVHRLLGTADDARLSRLVDRLAEADPAGVLAELEQALGEGVDLAKFTEQLLGYLRDVMVTGLGADRTGLLYADAGDVAGLKRAAERLGIQRLLGMMQLVDHALSRLRYSAQGRTVIELALVRAATLEDLDALAELVDQTRRGLSGQPDSPGVGSAAAKKKRALSLERSQPDETRTTAAARPSSHPPGDTDYAAPDAGLEAERGFSGERLAAEIAREDTALADPPATGAGPPAEGLELGPENAGQVWEEALGRLSPLVAAQARNVERVHVAGPRQLVLVFREKYTSCKAFCERPDRASRLRDALAEVTGSVISLQFEVEPDPVAAQAASAPARRGTSQRERLFEAARHPLVALAAELFDARAVAVEEAPRAGTTEPLVDEVPGEAPHE